MLFRSKKGASSNEIWASSFRRMIMINKNGVPSKITQHGTNCSVGLARYAIMGMLPTPTAQDFTRRGPNSQQQGLPELVYRMSMDLLPTPRANKVNGCDLHNPNIANRNKGNLEEAVAQMIMLPTPNASEAEKYTKTYNPNSQMGRGLTAMAANGDDAGAIGYLIAISSFIVPILR